jgi:hypothetical protein
MMVLIRVITSPLTFATNGSARSVNEYKYPNKNIVTYLIVCGFVNYAVSNMCTHSYAHAHTHTDAHTHTSVTSIVDTTGSLIIRYIIFRYIIFRIIIFPSLILYFFTVLHIID